MLLNKVIISLFVIMMITITSSNLFAYEANCKFTSGAAVGKSFYIKVSNKRMLMNASYGTFTGIYTGSVFANGKKFLYYNDNYDGPSYNKICFGIFKPDGSFTVY